MLHDQRKVQTLIQEEKDKNAHSPKRQQVIYVLFANDFFPPQLTIK